MIDLKEALAGSELSYEEMTNVAAKSAKENERLKRGNEGELQAAPALIAEGERPQGQGKLFQRIQRISNTNYALKRY